MAAHPFASSSPSRSAPLQQLLDTGLIWKGQQASQDQFSSSCVSSSPARFSDLMQYLTVGALHEWAFDLSLFPLSFQNIAPHSVLALLFEKLHQTQKFAIAWIGKDVWPYPHLFYYHGNSPSTLHERSLFFDPPHRQLLLWTLQQVITSPLIETVVVNAAQWKFATTRKFQLCAREGRSRIICIRPAAELSLPSAAHTKWLVRPALSSDFSWSVTLLRAHALLEPKEWIVSFAGASPQHHPAETYPTRAGFPKDNSPEADARETDLLEAEHSPTQRLYGSL